jgi:hypothetical protein
VCAPADVSDFKPTVRPPIGPYAGACTNMQLVELMDACFAALSTQEACSAWEADPGNAGCLGCWAGPETAATWAPYLFLTNPGQSDYLNVSGCIALADPGEMACAETLQAALECEFASCIGSCPIPTMGSVASIQVAHNQLDDCYDNSDMAGCKTLVSSGNACAATVADSGAAFCFVASMQVPALLQFFTLACGMPPDAGADAAPE